MPAPKRKRPSAPKAGRKKDKPEAPVSRTQRAARGTGRPRGR